MCESKTEQVDFYTDKDMKIILYGKKMIPKWILKSPNSMVLLKQCSQSQLSGRIGGKVLRFSPGNMLNIKEKNVLEIKRNRPHCQESCLSLNSRPSSGYQLQKLRGEGGGGGNGNVSAVTVAARGGQSSMIPARVRAAPGAEV